MSGAVVDVRAPELELGIPSRIESIVAAAGPGGIVVIGCGAAKLGHAAPAAELYTGQHFKVCRSTAEALAAPGCWFILSARYGLVEPTAVLEPYELRLGQPGAVQWPVVRRQALRLGVFSDRVTALCGTPYADLLEHVFRDVRRPLAGLGIGYQRAMMKALRQAAG